MTEQIEDGKAPELSWWQKTIIYEIYVKSFYDSNGDGIGDLQGIIQKLEYIKSLNVKCIWLTPIYPGGGKDGGYDLTSITDIDPIYGTMKDYEELVEKLHQNNMHLIMDFVPNHTSDKHQWFKESCKNDSPDNLFRDYYVWHPSKDPTKLPNNWVFNIQIITYSIEK
jgi:glycosidase